MSASTAHDTRPTNPDHAAAYDRGRAVGAAYVLNTGADDLLLIAAQRAVGAQRLTYLTQGDWEGVWQATGCVQVLREAREA